WRAAYYVETVAGPIPEKWRLPPEIGGTGRPTPSEPDSGRRARPARDVHSQSRRRGDAGGQSNQVGLREGCGSCGSQVHRLSDVGATGMAQDCATPASSSSGYNTPAGL